MLDMSSGFIRALQPPPVFGSGRGEERFQSLGRWDRGILEQCTEARMIVEARTDAERELDERSEVRGAAQTVLPGADGCVLCEIRQERLTAIGNLGERRCPLPRPLPCRGSSGREGERFNLLRADDEHSFAVILAGSAVFGMLHIAC